MALATWTFFDIAARVQVDVGQPVRYVGTAELFAAIVAALLPAICVPTFNARERMAVTAARRTHTSISAALALAPLLVLGVWYLSVRVHAPLQDLPPLHEFTGNFVLIGALGLASTLALGPRLGPPATLAACYALAGLQQVWPDSVLATAFSTATRWNTTWWMVAAVYGAAITADYLLRSVPRHAVYDS